MKTGNRKGWTGIVMALFAAVVACALPSASGGDRPNVIFIMADDLGYNDLAAYGQGVFPTPHTDRLARQGVRLTSAYSPSSVCSPTRYAVLTGTDPLRRYITSHVLFNAEPLVIGTGETTVASLLKQAGYATGVIGKWHPWLRAATMKTGWWSAVPSPARQSVLRLSKGMQGGGNDHLRQMGRTAVLSVKNGCRYEHQLRKDAR